MDFNFFLIFTNKLLFVEFCLGVLKSITLKFLYLQAKYQTDSMALNNQELDLRKTTSFQKQFFIHDQEILDYRWNLCKGCEFLKDDDRCSSCGCYMKIKHRIANARCPLNPPKWESVFKKGKVLNGDPITS